MDMDIYTIVAGQLRLKRLQAGLTIEELAAAAGISTSFLAYVETNKKKPSLATVAKLAGALHIPVSQLLDEKHALHISKEKQKTLHMLLRLLKNQSPEHVATIFLVARFIVKHCMKA